MTGIDGGLAEGIVAIHGTAHKCWGGPLGALPDNCDGCGQPWPCPTLLLVYDALGEPHPKQRTTACPGHVPTADGEAWNMCEADNGHGGNHRTADGRESVPGVQPWWSKA